MEIRRTHRGKSLPKGTHWPVGQVLQLGTPYRTVSATNRKDISVV